MVLNDIKWSKIETIKYHRKSDFFTPKHMVITDASHDSWVGHFESLSTSGRWRDSETDLNINAKGLLAIYRSLTVLCADIYSSTIFIKSGNITTVPYL